MVALYISKHPGSRFKEIFRGMNQEGLKISEVTLSARLKDMRDTERKGGPMLTNDEGRYFLNSKYRMQLVEQNEKIEEIIFRGTRQLHLLRWMKSPRNAIDTGLEWLVRDYYWALRQTLTDRGRMEAYLWMFMMSLMRDMTTLVDSLWDSPESLDVIAEASDGVEEFFKKEQQKRFKIVVREYPKKIRPLGIAYLKSLERAIQEKPDHSPLPLEWIQGIIKGGRARKMFEEELGRKAGIIELMQLAKVVR